ncbi:hypothetical protein H0H92_016083 [Tricholoma furcatifolium]|nr:hypothetical protein H0H92_016083 [Tricholoma furcatifolium]
MKFNPPSIALLLSALYFKLASSQSISIGYPLNGTSVAAGSKLLVEIDRPDTISSSVEVAVVIGLQSCPTGPCYPVASSVGTPLYNGPYNPQFQSGSPGKPPHQNFTITIPADTPVGKAQLGIAHFMLLGASLYADVQTLSIDLDITSPEPNSATRFERIHARKIRRQ